ncbi:hypothetical protein OROGR_001235 [Orobanche gracilis]
MSARILRLRTEHQPLNDSDPGADPDPGNATAEKPKKMTVLDLGNGSEVLHMPRFISYQDSWKYFDYLDENIPWTRPTIRVFARSHVQPRDICYIASEGLTQLGYGGFRPPAYSWDEFPPLKDILDLVHRVLPGSSFNSLLLNRYKGGNDYVGWHADDEKLYGSTPEIASVSFGCERDFILKKKPNKDEICLKRDGAPVRRLDWWQEKETMRGRGRPKQTWKKVVESDMNFLGIEENLVVDRTERRDRIYAPDMTLVVKSAIGNEDEPPRKRSKKANSSDQHAFLLNHGSLLVMRGHTQRDWLHSVPKRVKAESVRINLTFRRILF